MTARYGWVAALVTALVACAKNESSENTESARSAAQNRDVQALMKALVGPQLKSRRMPELAESLETVAALAPTGYPDWEAMARRGAQAAQSLDIDATRASCGGCHDAYRKQYKAEFGSQTRLARTPETE